jgi:hypothetical protein
MLSLMVLALQVAVPPAGAPVPQAVPASPAGIQAQVAPMRYDAWKQMTAQQRLDYAGVTIQGLRRNPVLARCAALEPRALAEGIDKAATPGELLIMAVATATYRLCSVG